VLHDGFSPGENGDGSWFRGKLTPPPLPGKGWLAIRDQNQSWKAEWNRRWTQMNTNELNSETGISRDTYPRLSVVSLAAAFEIHRELSQESKTRLNRWWRPINADLERGKTRGYSDVFAFIGVHRRLPEFLMFLRPALVTGPWYFFGALAVPECRGPWIVSRSAPKDVTGEEFPAARML